MSNLRLSLVASIVLMAGTSFAYPRYVGVKTGIDPSVRQRGTGFFRTWQDKDGRWWLLDPNGRGMIVLGIEHVNMVGFVDHGRYPIKEFNLAKYGSEEKWAKTASARVADWGFNFLGSGASEHVMHRNAAHTRLVWLGAELAKNWRENADPELWILPGGDLPCLAMPNMFSPRFEAEIARLAKERCSPHRNDPWLVGYFSDNELRWCGKTGDGIPQGLGLLASVSELPDGHSARRALERFMAERGRTVATATDEDRRAFVDLAAERYFSVVAKCIRAADPNHLYLGCRFSGIADNRFALAAAGRHCDVVTVNCYPWVDLDRRVVLEHGGKGALPLAEVLGEVYRQTGKPLLATEWSFPAYDSGLPCTGGAGQRFYTQMERARATCLCAQTMMALPFSLGYDYFMYPDEPCLDLNDHTRENSNYGLVSGRDEPYGPITAMFTRLNAEALKWRKKDPPAVRPSKRVQMTVGECLTALEGNGVSNGRGRVGFSRTGSAWRVDSPSGLRLEGTEGGHDLVERILFNGQVVGRMDAMISTWHGEGGDWKNVMWRDVSRVEKVSWSEGANGLGTLSCTCLWDCGAERSFVDIDLTVLPNRPGFVAAVRRFRPVGEVPVTIRGFYLRPWTVWASEAVNAYKHYAWKGFDGNAWYSEKQGLFAGVCTASPEVLEMNLDLRTDLSPTGVASQHPDVSFKPDGERREVAPGTVYEPKGAWCVYLAGSGGHREFVRVSRQALESLARTDKEVWSW